MTTELRSALSLLRHDPKGFSRRFLSDDNLNIHKKQLIDFACQELGMASFADLGGVWNVDGGYSIYAMDHHGIRQAVMVDEEITPAVWEKQRKHPGLRVIEGNFGDPLVRDQVGNVDGIFFFDVLLHQVRPDWHEILEMYSGAARLFLVFNQQFTNFAKTTRLLDLGREEYFRNVPHAEDVGRYKTLFQNLDAIDPKCGKPYRDIPHIWQWGIVDSDLINRMQHLDFKMQFYKNCGRCGQLKNVENHAFVFSL